jgi:CheY-like chemotaxis protein
LCILSYFPFKREFPVKPITCLLIDDDIDDQEIFLSALSNIKIEIKNEVAFNGHEALQKLISGNVQPDIIFLDLNMPLMNGRQFLKEVNRRGVLTGIPIVILSTSSDKDTIAETLSLGAREFITKPDNFNDWERTLTTVLQNLVEGTMAL